MSHEPPVSTALVRTARAIAARSTSGELPEYINKDEVDRVLAGLEAKPRVRALVRFLWLTGCRISEALVVLVSDLDMNLRIVQVRTLKKRRPERRSLPLPPAYLGELALIFLARAEANQDYDLPREARVFPWSRSRAFELVRDACLAAGIERRRCHPHVFRHGHAIFALKNGVPLNVLQRALGHGFLSTTALYTKVTGDDVAREYERIAW